MDGLGIDPDEMGGAPRDWDAPACPTRSRGRCCSWRRRRRATCRARRSTSVAARRTPPLDESPCDRHRRRCVRRHDPRRDGAALRRARLRPPRRREPPLDGLDADAVAGLAVPIGDRISPSERAPAARTCRCSSAGARTASTRRWRCSASSRGAAGAGAAQRRRQHREGRGDPRRGPGADPHPRHRPRHDVGRGSHPLAAPRDHVQLRQAAPGDPSSTPTTGGVVDFAAVLAELERLDYRGLISIEYFDLPDMRMPLDDPVGHASRSPRTSARSCLIHCTVTSALRTSRDNEMRSASIRTRSRSATVVRNGYLARTSATTAGSTSGSRVCSTAASVPPAFAERLHDRAVARVVELAAAADPVHADHVGLVLDRPGPQQRAPVVATRRRPVGDDDVAVGVGREGPELVGEAQVVADEEAAADALDVDGDALVARRVLLVLAAVAEGVDLAVPRRARRRARRGSACSTAVRRRAAPRAPIRTPRRRAACLLDEELRARTVERLGDAIGVHREPGREHLGEHDECARCCAASAIRRRGARSSRRGPPTRCRAGARRPSRAQPPQARRRRRR